MSEKFGWAALLIAFACLVPNASPVFGHAVDETYIWLNPQSTHFDGRIEFRLDDLRKHLEMDIPTEYEGAKETILSKKKELEEYVRTHFGLKQIDGSEIKFEIVKVDLLKNDYFGHFAQLFFKSEEFAETPSEIQVRSDFLFEQDKFSRCLLCMEFNHFTGESHPERFHHAIFSPWTAEQTIDFRNVVEVKRGRKYYVWEGVRHIWIGLDHILFLITLLLASVLVKRRVDNVDSDEKALLEKPDDETRTAKYDWVPVEGFGGALFNVLKIVTIFTVAHSITLALASLGIINLPSQLVESVIALSIVLVAINNIIPTFRDKTWLILFLFGLFHGLGFASVMQNLPFRMPNLTTLLVCFNVGVELGQLAIVAAVFPFIFLLRKSKFYKPVVLTGGSLVIIVIAGKWFVERAMGWG